MYYHVAPQRHRQSIATHGLDATREEADHNHVFDSLEAAKRYAPYTMLDMPYDIYEVNGEGHPWESDPMFNNTAWPDSDEPLSGAYRSTVPVPPENLKIVHSVDKPVPFERTASPRPVYRVVRAEETPEIENSFPRRGTTATMSTRD